MTERPTMLFVCSATFMLGLDYGHLVAFFERAGARVICCVPRVSDTPGGEGLPSGVELSRIPLDRKTGVVKRVLGTLFESYRLSRAHPDGVFTLITAQAVLLAGGPLRLMNRNAIFLLCGMGTLFSSDRPLFRALRPLVKLFFRFLFSGRNSRVIVQNHDDLRYVTEELDAHDAAVMPGCGADPAKFSFAEKPPKRDRKVILVPARIIIEKGIFEAAEASRILSDRGIAHEMRFSSSIDRGNPMSLTDDDLAELTARTPTVAFIGFQPDMAPVYADSDVICLPSYREGLPTALIEASACGLPIVTTDVQGCREIVTDGFNGLIVPPRDALALADALQRLLTDESLSDRLRRNGHARFHSSYTREASLAATLPVYRSLGAIG